MMNKNLLLIVFALLVSFGFCANSFGQTQEPSEELKAFRGDRIYEFMKQRANWEYDDTPFVEIMDELRANYGINVYLDQSAIDDSLTTDDLITFNARDLRSQTSLKLMLDQHNATFIIRDDVLMIISKDVAKDPEFLVRKIINCKELLDKIAVVERAQMNCARKPVQPFTDSSEASGDGEKPTDAKFGAFAADNLLEAIKTSVTPDDWAETNGNGTVMIVGNCLIIHQTNQAIHQIEMLLEELSLVME